MDILKARNIVKQFSNHLALDKVSIHVPEGAIYGLLGPNGAGKTTLLRIINQITAPDEGEVEFKNRKLKADDVFDIGYLPEERGLYKKMTVGEQAMYLAQLKGMKRSEAVKKLRYWFEKFEIQPWWNKKVEELSKGMQQKLQFIVTILHEPSLLIFDEPFSGFDPINARILKQEIQELKKKGATIIFSTHDMGSVEELCNHITLINRSRTLLEGPIDKVREEYRTNRFEVIFEGSPNLLDFTLSSQYKIIENTPVNGTQRLLIEIVDGISTNEIISSLLTRGKIISFNEKLPSMNDIFIQVVEEENKKTDRKSN
ncbi:MAG TPA: ABC transporter ATP-binding protein [Bacteroidetes bacterium]|nr:ABC transporter ATP-binding protein [Bacteroidota bacterium]